VFVGRPGEGAERVSEVCVDAFEAARLTARPGVTGGAVYDAWQAVVDDAGLSHYRRHHCGYATGIGFPPSWSGGGIPRALRRASTSPLAEGMVFHMMSWMMETGSGDYVVSDPVVVTADGAERLTSSVQTLRVV
jgi:Xaa-Pro dipeptidase